MQLRARRRQDDEMIEGEPSRLGGRRDRRSEEGQEPNVQEEPSGSRGADEEAVLSNDRPEGVRDQLERLATQIRGLQHQVEELAARRSDAVAAEASERVAAIVQAAEESAAEITAHAHQEASDLRERLRAEAQAEADRIRIDAQAEASKIRTEAHAAASLLREETLAEVRLEVDRICARLADELLTSARQAIDRIVGSAASPRREPATEPSAHPEPEEPADVDVEVAVDELQSAAAVLEQSLRHLQEIGQGLPEVQ
jgi:cell division septum initiation protein DivIVA